MPRSRSLPHPRPARSPADAIDGDIQTIRRERVILDADLARIYGVETRVLKQAVRRNRGKFPSDFLFELAWEEAVITHSSQHHAITKLKSQTVILKQGRHLKHLPYAFTEHGTIMAANILNSPQAAQMSVFVVRAFIKMRAVLTDTRELARKLAALGHELKTRLDTHEPAIVDVLQRIMALIEPPTPPPDAPGREMGFHSTLASQTTGSA